MTYDNNKGTSGISILEGMPFSKEHVLYDEIRSVSSFPIHILPSFFQGMLIEYWDVARYPIDYTAAAIIAAISICMGNRFSLYVNDKWIAHPLIWCVIVGKPGANKSHPLKTILKPIIEIDRKEITKFNNAYQHYLSHLEGWKKTSKKDNNNIEEIYMTTCKQYIAQDVTQEELVQMLIDNPNGILFYNDELTSIFSNFDRYQKGSFEEMMLMCYSQQVLKINRKGDKRKLFVNHPFLSVVGGIQTNIISDMLSGKRADNGFFARFCFFLPTSSKKFPPKDKTDSNRIYEDCWREMVSKNLNDDTEHTLVFDSEAKQLVLKIRTNYTDLYNQENDDVRASIIAKIETQFIRLIMICHYIRYLCKEDIELTIVDCQSVENAKVISDYLLDNAFKLLKATYVKKMSKDKQLVFDALPSTFTYQEGWSIVEKLNNKNIIKMSQSTYQRMLGDYDEQLLQKDRHGHYCKL